MKAEKNRLIKAHERLKASVEKRERDLLNEDFIKRASQNAIEKQQALLEKGKRELSEIELKLTL